MKQVDLAKRKGHKEGTLAKSKFELRKNSACGKDTLNDVLP